MCTAGFIAALISMANLKNGGINSALLILTNDIGRGTE